MYKKFVTWAKDFDYDHRMLVSISIAVLFCAACVYAAPYLAQ